MYKLLLKHLPTGNIKEVEFTTKEEMEIYKKYKSIFHGWDKPQKWILDYMLQEEDKKHVVTEQKRDSGLWYLVKPEWNFSDTQPDREEDLKHFWEVLRIKRNALLSDTDYTQIADCSLNSKQKLMYREYREFLRNITNNYNDRSIENAKIMTFEEWLDYFKK